METNFIYSTNYNDALKKIIARIGGRKVDLGIRHLLIVPERYTLLAEKLLYQNSSGSFDVEVLSLSRLFYRMQISTPLISREGAIMLIRGMIPSLNLQCFHRSASYRGFCEKAYDAINDFAASGISPDDIPTSSPKLVDLKSIYAMYLERISGRFVDSMGKLALIAREAGASKYLDNVHIYVANFDYVDKATRRVMDALKDRALSFTECRIQGEPKVGSAEKYCGEGALAVKEVAKRIRYEAYNGALYEGMAVIVGNADYARIKRIFKEFDIPCFVAESKRLSDYALSVFLTELFECARNKRRENFIELSKNLYTGLSKLSADEFENYVNKKLIDYKGFYGEFDDCPQCEETRKRLIGIVEPVERKIKNVKDAKSFGKLIEDVFEIVGAENLTEKAYDSDAPVERIRGLVALMEQVGIVGNFEFISAVFEEGLRASKISSLPESGGVIVGDPAALRGGKFDFIAVLGFDDGFLPQIYDDSSLIGDDEKAFFSQMERAEQINTRYELELKAALASAKKLFITYTKPSGMADEIACRENPYLNQEVFNAGSKKHATELLISLVKRMENAEGDYTRFVNALYKSVNSEDMFLPIRRDKIFEADKLFFAKGTTSISQLQSYFRCPFKHFADYGLRLSERDSGEMTSLDVGSFMHLIVESVIKSGSSDINLAVEEAVAKIVDGGEKYALEANKRQIDQLKAEAKETLQIYKRHLNKGKFSPIGQEIKFETNLGDIKLVGKIDMADEYNNYIRLIDYKTGNSDISFKDVYYGNKLQLPLYMAAAKALGYKAAAMFNFPFSYKWICDKKDHRFSGFMLNNTELAYAIDGTIGEGESEVYGFSLTQKGSLSLRNRNIMSDSEMDSFIDYAVKVSENAIKEIKDGYVLASPCDKACSSCEYKCLCSKKIPRKLIAVSKSVLANVNMGVGND